MKRHIVGMVAGIVVLAASSVEADALRWGLYTSTAGTELSYWGQ